MSLSMPVLVGRGKLQESLITDTDLDRYKKMSSNITVKEYFQSGHDLKGSEKKLFYTDVTDFLDTLSEGFNQRETLEATRKAGAN
jgi:hypothetical protein